MAFLKFVTSCPGTITYGVALFSEVSARCCRGLSKKKSRQSQKELQLTQRRATLPVAGLVLQVLGVNHSKVSDSSVKLG